MGNSVNGAVDLYESAVGLESTNSKERTGNKDRKASKKDPNPVGSDWRSNLEENSVVRVWDTIMQTSYPAVVTRVGEKDLNLRFCPKYPDGSYCGCVVDQKTSRDSKIVNPYLSTRKAPPKKESLLNAQCRTESLDHLSDMMRGTLEAAKTGADKENLVLTQGVKARPPPPPPVVRKMVAHLPPPRLQSIDEYD
jgi:hypothetical protein